MAASCDSGGGLVVCRVSVDRLAAVPADVPCGGGWCGGVVAVPASGVMLWGRTGGDTDHYTIYRTPNTQASSLKILKPLIHFSRGRGLEQQK